MANKKKTNVAAYTNLALTLFENAQNAGQDGLQVVTEEFQGIPANRLTAAQKKDVLDWLTNRYIPTYENKQQVQYSTTVKRYTLPELIDFIKEETYKEIGTSNTMYFLDKSEDRGCLNCRARYEQRQQRIEDIEFRIKDYEQRAAEESDEDDKGTFLEAADLLRQKLAFEKNYTPESQHEEYERTGDVFASRSFVEFPLNKKINSLYDDFNVVVLYYDNLVTDEVIKSLEQAETEEEKKQIVKDNIEITHILLSLSTGGRANIVIYGKVDPLYTDATDGATQTIPAIYADFDYLTLSDCEAIKNNDLQQLIQERIDMQKENLTCISEQLIKGELYQIMRSPRGNEYIKYVCPSTQRVYYNALNHEYLAESKYYKAGEPDTYALAWYSVANLFIELTPEEIAKPSIAC